MDTNGTLDIAEDVVNRIRRHEIFKTMAPREQQIVLYLQEGMPHKDIAHRLGVTRVRVEQIILQMIIKYGNKE